VSYTVEGPSTEEGAADPRGGQPAGPGTTFPTWESRHCGCAAPPHDSRGPESRTFDLSRHSFTSGARGGGRPGTGGGAGHEGHAGAARWKKGRGGQAGGGGGAAAPGREAWTLRRRWDVGRGGGPGAIGWPADGGQGQPARRGGCGSAHSPRLVHELRARKRLWGGSKYPPRPGCGDPGGLPHGHGAGEGSGVAGRGALVGRITARPVFPLRTAGPSAEGRLQDRPETKVPKRMLGESSSGGATSPYVGG